MRAAHADECELVLHCAPVVSAMVVCASGRRVIVGNGLWRDFYLK